MGLGWTGGAFLAGALVGWLGLVPTLFVLASTGVLATVVAWTSPLRGMVTGSGSRRPFAELPTAAGGVRVAGEVRAAHDHRSPAPLVRAGRTDVRRPRQVLGRGHQHRQGAVAADWETTRWAAT